MNKKQMKKDIADLSERGHVTQKDMKIMIEVIGGLFEYIGALEKKIKGFETQPPCNCAKENIKD